MLLFRQNFIDTVHPQFLPDAWDLHHATPRNFGPYSIYSAASGEVASLQRNP